MSFVCRVFIGWFDPPDLGVRGVIRPAKALGTNHVHRLQAACDELFDINVRLINFLTDDGLLCFENGVVSHDTYRIACVAHELFGMSACDEAHWWCPIYPAEDWAVSDVETLSEHWRAQHTDWTEDRVRAQAQSDHLWLSKRKEFQRNTQARVKSFAKTWLCLN